MTSANSGYESLTPYLRIANMDESLTFYRAALGFEVTNKVEHEGSISWAFLRSGPISLMLSVWPARSLEHDDDDEHAHQPWQGVGLVNSWPDINLVTFLYVQDADAAYERVRAAGYEPLDSPTDQPYGLREFLVRDPDGHCFVIGQRIR
jgi:uncharacterized glyoxalase superfamily protein PhnB